MHIWYFKATGLWNLPRLSAKSRGWCFFERFDVGFLAKRLGFSIERMSVLRDYDRNMSWKAWRSCSSVR
jgi:hypothetical protein